MGSTGEHQQAWPPARSPSLPRQTPLLPPGATCLLRRGQLSRQQAVEGPVGGPKAAGEHQDVCVQAAAAGPRRHKLLVPRLYVGGQLYVLRAGAGRGGEHTNGDWKGGA